MSQYFFLLITTFTLLTSIDTLQEIGKTEGNKPQQEQTTQEDRHLAIAFQKWDFAFMLPSQKWHPYKTQENLKTDSLALYLYEREGVLNKEGIEINPVISFTFEKVPRNIDL
ncbi:hypothetical protein J7M07_04920, partial [bacterium]|nr:hypothetical protein [bacterium]